MRRVKPRRIGMQLAIPRSGCWSDELRAFEESQVTLLRGRMPVARRFVRRDYDTHARRPLGYARRSTRPRRHARRSPRGRDDADESNGPRGACSGRAHPDAATENDELPPREARAALPRHAVAG